MVPVERQTSMAAGFERKNAGTIVAGTEILDTLRVISPILWVSVGNRSEYRLGTAKNSVPDTRFRSLN